MPPAGDARAAWLPPASVKVLALGDAARRRDEAYVDRAEILPVDGAMYLKRTAPVCQNQQEWFSYGRDWVVVRRYDNALKPSIPAKTAPLKGSERKALRARAARRCPFDATRGGGTGRARGRHTETLERPRGERRGYAQRLGVGVRPAVRNIGRIGAAAAIGGTFPRGISTS